MAQNETTVRRRRGGQATGGGSAANGSAGQASTAGGDGGAQAGNETAQQQQEQPNFRNAMRQALMRTVLMYLMYHYLGKKSPTAQNDATTEPAAPASKLSSLLGAASKGNPKHYSKRLSHAFPVDIPLEFRVFTSLNPNMTFHEASQLGETTAIWSRKNVTFNTVSESYIYENLTLNVPEPVRTKNSTWYSHIFIGILDIWDKSEPSDLEVASRVLYARHEIIGWRVVDLNKKAKNLLGAEIEGGDSSEDDLSAEAVQEESLSEDEASNNAENAETASVRYDQVWKPTMPIIIVTAQGPLVLSQMPASASSAFAVDDNQHFYYPPMHVNEFWMLQDSLQLMNDTVKEVKMEMSFTPVGLYKWTMYKQFDSMWQKQIDFGTMKPHEPDTLKVMFIETNPWLLGTTMVVSLAHTVLEMLAFRNDISHWKNIKTMEGISVRSMVWKIVMEVIIFLYLWDNETSWMITIGNGVGLVLAFWKLGKAVKFENFGKRKLLGFIPWFDMVDRESYSKETKEYDEQAMRYLGYALYPLVIGYALYSLKYEMHKSWYSWIISSLVGAVYAFGFIMMFPQIFINYKLKSVAHLPMKAMMYKTLNTVIDDLFSFIIKMPWLHRLACFRDDVVFLMFLYQRWIYPIDTTRVNEFGQQFDEDGKQKVAEGTDNNVDDGATERNAADNTTESSAVVEDTTSVARSTGGESSAEAAGAESSADVGDGRSEAEAPEEMSIESAKEKGLEEKKND